MKHELVRIALVGLLSCPSTWAQSAPGSVDDGSVRIAERFVGEEDYPAAGVGLGQGWDSYLGQRTQQHCIEVNATPGELEVFQARASFVDLYDREQLFRELKMSAKASYGGMVSGRASFSQSVKIDSKNRNILGKVFVNNGGSYVVPARKEDGIKLTQTALKLLSDKKLDEFRRRCGDSFVTAIHKGGRYDAVFSLREDSKEVIERMKLSIKGGVGGFSGSANAGSLLKKVGSSGRLTVETNQTGGQPGIVPGGVAATGAAPAPANQPTAGGGVFTADNVIKKISEFEMMKDEFAKPYAISLESYKVASNYPQELLDDELYANNILELSANVWRYRELADLYSSAAIAAGGFYFPFTSDLTSGGTKPNQDLTIQDLAVLSAKKASLLYSISNCFDGLAAVCASRTSCKVSDVFSAPFLERSCPQAFSDATVWASIRGVGKGSQDDFQKILVEASRSADPVLKKLAPAGPIAIDNLVKEINKAVSILLPKAAPAANAPAGNNPPASATVLSDIPPQSESSQSGDVSVYSPAEVYYSLLAEAPMRRGPLTGNAPAATDTDDQLNQVLWLCAAYENTGADACSTFKFSDVAVSKPANGPAPTIDHGLQKTKQAAALFRQWVAHERLMPLVRAYCVNPGHLMCLGPDRVLLIANSLPVTFNWERNFATTPPPTPPAVVTQVRPTPNYPRYTGNEFMKRH